ncbi:MAG: nitroreductase family protein [Chloroflexota bacterium]
MQPIEFNLDLHALLRSRRSVRRFTDQDVPKELLERIIESASYAPNAHNRQPWRFIVLTSSESKASLADAMGVDFHRTLITEGLTPAQADTQVQRSRTRITQAPAAILLCLDTSTLDNYDDPIRQQGELTMAVQSVAMAGSYLLLAAHAEGLGGVWICAPLFTPQPVQEVLDLPKEWLPQGLVLLGYPAKTPNPHPRVLIETVTKFL